MGEGERAVGRPPWSEASGADASFAAALPDLFRLAYRVAFKILGDRGDAEDVAQETLARALVRWRALRNRPYGWVSHVASNLAIDRYRKRRRGTGGTGDRPDHADDFVAERSDLVRVGAQSSVSDGVLWLTGTSTDACADPRTGQVRASVSAAAIAGVDDPEAVDGVVYALPENGGVVAITPPAVRFET
jgi:DNA-directed RNA polymerase specialized sigma24 family protein